MNIFVFNTAEEFLKKVKKLNCDDYYRHCINYSFGETSIVEFNKLFHFDKGTEYDNLYFLIESDKKLVSTMYLDIDKTNSLVYVHDLVSCVKGKGKVLLDEAIKISKEKGFYLKLDSINKFVEDYYSKLGFSKFGDEMFFFEQNKKDISYTLHSNYGKEYNLYSVQIQNRETKYTYASYLFLIKKKEKVLKEITCSFGPGLLDEEINSIKLNFIEFLKIDNLLKDYVNCFKHIDLPF